MENLQDFYSCKNYGKSGKLDSCWLCCVITITPHILYSISLNVYMSRRLLFSFSAVADDLWLAFCAYVRTYVSSTYYLILIIILFGTPHGRQRKKKLINEIKDRCLDKIHACVRQKDLSKQKIIKTYCYNVFKEMFTFLFLFF